MESVGLDCRADWTVACEMGEGQCWEVYYGRVLKLVVFELGTDHSSRWAHWQTTHKVGLFEWASGLEIGMQGQVYKNAEAENAFSVKTIKDLSVIKRLVSVVNHVVPSRTGIDGRNRSRSTSVRGRKRCYFIDDQSRADHLCDTGRRSVDGFNRIWKGRREG